MPSTKKLLSIQNLKKYFPLAKTSLFSRAQLYIRANEDITLDIFQGETLGVVGESGCGKSTFGRVLLQLYSQTAGSTLYYGATLADFAPSYVGHTLKHLTQYQRKLQRAAQQARALEAKVEAAGGEDQADFHLLQSRNLAQAEEKTCLARMVEILGGFYAHDPGGEGVNLLLRLYREAARGRPTAALRQQLEALRAHYGDVPEFQKYEALRSDGIDLSRLRYSEMRLLRKDLQIIFQDPYSSLNPRMTIGQIIEEGLVTHRLYKRGDPAMRAHILKTMGQCGLQDYMLHRYPHQFSGGQRQRVAIARALAVQPKFIVCDECVSALDVSIQSQIINLLQQLRQEQNLTYLFISHDLSVVRYISDRIVVMYLGSIMELGPADALFQDPRHPYTVALLSAIPTTSQDAGQKEKIILEGSIPSPIRPPSGCKFHTRCYMACDKCKRVPPPLLEVTPGHWAACHFPEAKLDAKGKLLHPLDRKEAKG